MAAVKPNERRTLLVKAFITAVRRLNGVVNSKELLHRLI